LLAVLEQAPTHNHLVLFHEHCLVKAEVVEASQPVLAHPLVVIVTLALAWEQVLEMEEALVLELVLEEALALLPVPVRMR
jgi:hypothetical protein